MCIRLDITAVADHNLRFGYALIQPPVFFPVVVVGRLPDVSEVVFRIGAFLVDCGEEKRNMGIIRQIRLNHIHKGRTGRVAQAVQFRPDTHVFLGSSSALRVRIHPVAAYFRCGSIRDLHCSGFIQFEHTVCKTAVTQQPDNHRQQNQRDNNSHDAFENNAFVGLLHQQLSSVVSRIIIDLFYSANAIPATLSEPQDSYRECSSYFTISFSPQHTGRICHLAEKIFGISRHSPNWKNVPAHDIMTAGRLKGMETYTAAKGT